MSTEKWHLYNTVSQKTYLPCPVSQENTGGYSTKEQSKPRKKMWYRQLEIQHRRETKEGPRITALHGTQRAINPD